MERDGGEMSFIKLDRKIIDWEWFSDSNMVKLWVYLLVNAKYEDTNIQGRLIKRGQLITGRKKLSKELCLSEQQIRTCIKRLISTNEITTEATNKDTLITIVNYDKYQSSADENNQQINQPSNQQATNEQPTNNQQSTTYKEIKNIRNKEIKNIKHKYGQYQNVLLSDEELEKVKTEFPFDYKERIERVSSYCASTGRSYKNYLATIRNWARNEKTKIETGDLPQYDPTKNTTVEDEEEILKLMGRA